MHLDSQRLHGHSFFLLVWGFYIFKIFAVRYVPTPKYFLLPDCSVKICEKLTKFVVGVCLVNNYNTLFA